MSAWCVCGVCGEHPNGLSHRLTSVVYRIAPAAWVYPPPDSLRCAYEAACYGAAQQQVAANNHRLARAGR